MTNRRHTQNEILTAIDAMEARGWTINEDGSITNAKLQTKRLRHDPRAKNAEPRYFVVLDRGQATIKRSDLIAAKFDRIAATERPQPEARTLPEAQPQPVAAIEQPDEVEVDVWLNRRPETRSRPTGCAHCGGFMVRGDDNEHRCLQCGRANTPQRVLTPTERIWFRKG